MRSSNMAQRLVFFVCALCVCLPAATRAQVATIVRVPDNSIRLDGRLDDAAWEAAPAISDFTQKEPNEGEPATQRMEVKLVYDNDAVYVGARMFSRDAAAIQAPLGRRDFVGTQAEH